MILINPNIATVQTAPAGSADKLYLLPVDAENVEKVIRQLGCHVGGSVLQRGRCIASQHAALAVDATPLRVSRWHASRRAL